MHDLVIRGRTLLDGTGASGLLAAGIEREERRLAEVLEAIERRPRAIAVEAQVPHETVRADGIGERGVRNAEPRADEIERAAQIVRQGLVASALPGRLARGAPPGEAA